ncbi:eukaryotic translation initiation factor 3 subunit A-like protein [Tanacetum coccineum]|uniref:Eukaryotic translation initiation factor 3 subunit A-like protein n=1 Tax=Tanacetum coccineum TaxID=301880 RepID=A0ABQ5AQ98_9ASTR
MGPSRPFVDESILVEVDTVRGFVAGLGKLRIAMRNRLGVKHVEVKLVLERELVFSIIIRREDLYLLWFTLRNGKVFEIGVDGDNQQLEFSELLGFREAYKDIRIRWLEPKLKKLIEELHSNEIIDLWMPPLIQGWSFMSKVALAGKVSTVAPPKAKLSYDAYDLNMVGNELIGETSCGECFIGMGVLSMRPTFVGVRDGVCEVLLLDVDFDGACGGDEDFTLGCGEGVLSSRLSTLGTIITKLKLS